MHLSSSDSQIGCVGSSDISKTYIYMYIYQYYISIPIYQRHGMKDVHEALTWNQYQSFMSNISFITVSEDKYKYLKFLYSYYYMRI